ncbi:type VII secretion protein EccCa [Streptomyces sp. NPDC026673]|uniref:type VII secretion protein EccCa n=1 Tax=Streptomyces sp. NPDC026673 TaxID=3155724 RepID=UPI0033F7A584
MPQGELSLQEPPTQSEVVPDSSAIWTYGPMALMSVSMMMMFLRPGMSGGGGAFMYVVMGVMLLSAVGMVLGQVMRRNGERKQRTKGERRDYLRYLTQARKQVHRAVGEQRAALAWRHPDPVQLLSLARTSRLWERRPQDPDFAEVRLALGDQQLALKLVPLSTKPVEDLDPLSAHALRRFIRAFGNIREQPVAISLRSWARILMRGDSAAIRNVTRAMVAQLTTFHGPEDLWIAVCATPETRGEWEWLKWLPHHLHPQEHDGAGQLRMTASSINDLEELLGAEFRERPALDPQVAPGREEPFVVIIIDGAAVPNGHRINGPGFRNAVVIDVSETLEWRPGRVTVRLDVQPDQVRLVRTDRNRKEQTTDLGVPDVSGLRGSEALARLIAPFRMSLGRETSGDPMASDLELTALLGISDLHSHNPQAFWQRITDRTRLRVPIAVSADGTPVELDIKESAEGGMGPHGMLIGATGSGKSELLRTLVLALALTNSSEILNFVLVDFKGGATFLGLDELPHTSALITNLSDEVSLVERMQDALHGELVRRQELLRAAGNYTSALDYERARAAGAELDPLPSLFVVVDEFSELLSAHRDFMDLFVMIGRLGRSLGVHLLLASQRLDEGRMHHLEGHLSYRIGLRTFSAMESRGVLGVPDAYQLPPQPGAGYLKSGVEALTRFRAAYVSGNYRRRAGAVTRAQVESQMVPWTSDYVVPRAPVRQVAQPDETAAEKPLMTVALERLRDAGPPARQVWLPPLGVPASLDELLPGLAPTPDRGFAATGWPKSGALTVPVGLIDRPFEQRRDPLVVDLAAAGGHVAVVGGAQSGKSTLLRTLISALALTHTPEEVQFYCLDLGGGSLSSLAGLPHVGGVSSRLDTERISRTVAEVGAVLQHREEFFLEHNIDSMATYRRRRAAGEFAGEAHGDVFLVIDGWGTLRQDFDSLVDVVSQFASRGLNYGVHLMVSAARWLELQTAVRDQIVTRLELRLGDAMDSVVDTRKAARVPHSPGRGLTVGTKLHYLAALPRIDGSSSASDLAEGAANLVDKASAHWSGRSAPQVRMLPAQLPAAELPAPELGDGLRVPLGLDEENLAPVWHDFSRTPHLMGIGDSESGKTNLLRVVASAIMARYTPAEARILLVDYRRELAEAVPQEYRLGHAVALTQLQEMVSGAQRALKTRLPSEEISPARMRQADWWVGPRLFVLIDDYDMLSGSGFDNPLSPLFEFLALGHEVGLHVIVLRSASGAGRAQGDQLFRRLGDVNTPALLLSCPPSEGYVFGNVKPRKLPAGRARYIARRGITAMQTAVAP